MSVDTHAPATAAEQFALRQQSPVQRIQHLLHSHPAISPLLVLIVAMIVFSIINPRFAQPATLSIIIQQTAIIAALAIGQTLIVLTAGIDLSVGAICILSMLFMANLAANNGVPGLLALLLGSAWSTLCGSVNGVLGHPAQPAPVHRHVGDAEHLRRDRPALHRRGQRRQGGTCRRS